MVETIQVKLEEDREGFQNHAASQHETTVPSNNDSVAAAVAETDELDKQLAVKDFLDRICLVKLEGKKDAEGNVDTKLWPALKFGSKREVYEEVKKVNRGLSFKSVRYFKQQEENGNKVSGSCGIAYLLGMRKIEESFIPLSEDMAESFDERINETLDKEEYKCNQKFQLALAIVEKRYTDELSDSPPDGDDDHEEDDDDTSRDDTVAYNGSANQAHDDVDAISIEEDYTPAKAGGNDEKRKGEGDGTTSNRKKFFAKQTPASKKKVVPKQTPESKSCTIGVVTPLPANSDDKEISKHLVKARENSTPHSVMKHDEAWKLLEEKFGLTCVDGMFYLPPSRDQPVEDKPVASSLMGLRKDLCEKGLPGSSQPLSREEKIDIARWVLYAHVNGLRDGQYINPDGQGKPIRKFMDGWGVLRDNFGCRYSNGKYSVPTSPNGGDIKVFETTSEVDCHFARFGIQCIPDNPVEKLSQKDRLSIELFFATPSFETLNIL